MYGGTKESRMFKWQNLDEYGMEFQCYILFCYEKILDDNEVLLWSCVRLHHIVRNSQLVIIHRPFDF